MKKKISLFLLQSLLFSLLFYSTSGILDKYDEEFSEFNGKLANILQGNNFSLREFDEHGIPISNFSKLKIREISPFYVVHYGLIYSNNIIYPKQYNYLWEYNNSTKYWNVPPDEKYITKENFLYAADWVVKHATEDSYGNYHLFYEFDWPYKNLSGGKLKKPWHSGLTDGMALTLLSRAYVVTQNNIYKEVAFKLYKSVIADKKVGGSTIHLDNDDLWIEEYVASNLPDRDQPRVLNGMIYATFGLYFFEKTFEVENKLYHMYFQSIRNNIKKFDLDYWTAYDLIGTQANLKYHHIHIGLLKDMYQLTQDKYYDHLYEKWSKYSTSFIKRNFYHSTPTINSLMTLIEYISILILIQYLITYTYSFYRSLINKS